VLTTVSADDAGVTAHTRQGHDGLEAKNTLQQDQESGDLEPKEQESTIGDQGEV